ncbi:hypothetical protein [Bacillus sp. 1P02SD]|uniref:hypothetical protein n=1 Tax=Bacillus sp. 1P02SD TaxID=3132264 RepID=UPI00399F97BB
MLVGFGYWEAIINFTGTFLGAFLAAGASLLVINKQIAYDKNKDKTRKLEEYIKYTVEFRGYINAIMSSFDEVIKNMEHWLKNEKEYHITSNISVIKKYEEKHLVVEVDKIPLDIYRAIVLIKILVSNTTSSIEKYIETDDLRDRDNILKEYKELKDTVEYFISYTVEKENELKVTNK